MIEDIKKAATGQMKKAVEALATELQKIRTGRAHPSLLDHIQVSYYGTPTPLKQVANISAEDARTLLVQPWDKGMVTAVDKAIRESDLGLNPSTAGMTIRVPMPPLTEERRRELVKVAKKAGEECKVAIRKARHDAKDMIDSLQKEGEVGEDDADRARKELEDIVKNGTHKVDEIVSKKEADILEV